MRTRMVFRRHDEATVQAKLTIAVALTVALLTGFAFGTYVEATTHALRVARVTGTGYAQVLSPLDRLTTNTADIDDEGCQGECEANQA